jgi:thioredoxin 2
MAPVLERMAATRAGRLKVVKVDVDRSPGVSARFQVQGIPTLLLFQDGRLVGRKVGAAPEGALEAWLAAPAV